MAQISAVIITWNEERNIMRCIESLRGIADEIIVVDSFSTDRTVELAEKAGGRVFTHAFEGYRSQKNYAIQQATHQYVLSLDADEALDETLRRSISEIKHGLNGDACSFNRLTNYCGKWIRHCGWYPDTKVRLFDRSKCSWGGYEIHETLECRPGTSIQHLQGDLLHYSYYSIEEHRRQTEKYTTMSAQALFEKGKKPTFTKSYLSPLAKFLKTWIFQLGFMDGYYGFIVCSISAHATWLKYYKLRQLYR